jgi:hypothetical protein
VRRRAERLGGLETERHIDARLNQLGDLVDALRMAHPDHKQRSTAASDSS